MLKIVHIDDSQDELDLFSYKIRKVSQDLDYKAVLSRDDLFSAVEKDHWDCILTDYQMPEVDGLELIQQLRQRNISTPVIMVTGHGNEKVAAEAFRLGAHDYFNKNDAFASFERIVNSARIAKRQRQERMLRQLAEQALTENEMLMSRMIQMMPVPMAITHGDGRVLNINDKFVNTYGYTLNDIQTMDDWWRLAYQDAEYREAVRSDFMEKFARAVDGRTEKINATVTCRDGSTVNVDIYSNHYSEFFFHVHIVRNDQR